MNEKLIHVANFTDPLKKDEFIQKLDEENITYEILEQNRFVRVNSFIEWEIYIKKKDEEKVRKIIEKGKPR